MLEDDFTSLGDPVPSKTAAGNLDFCENLNPYFREHSYPQSNPLNLRERIAGAYGTIHGVQVAADPNTMLITNGAVDGLNLALTRLSRPGQTVALLSPSFIAFRHFAQVHRLRHRSFDLVGSDVDKVPFDLIRKAKPDFTILSNPNNPTGTTVALSEIEHLCALTEGFVIVDEAYIEFSGRESAIALLPRIGNLLVLRTFSKAFALPHARCGVVVGKPSVVDAIKCVQVPFSVSEFAHDQVQAQLDNLAHLRNSWLQVAEDRSRLYFQLSSLNLPGRILPSTANFLSVRSSAASHMHAHLLSDRIQALSPTIYPGYLRISLADRSHNERVVESFRRFKI